MKYLIYTIILFFFTQNLWAQLDIDGDSPGSMNWNDPVYNDFFDGSCTVNTLKSASRRTIWRWYQDDQIWTGKPYIDCAGETIGGKGCYLTCIAMMLTNSGDYITPLDLNKFVVDHRSYANSSCGLDGVTIVANRPSPEYKSPTLMFNQKETTDEPNIDLLKSTLNRGGFVIAHVNPCRHFILIYDWETILGYDVFYTADPVLSVTKKQLNEYVACDFRYYVPTSNAIASEIVVNGIKPESKLVKAIPGIPYIMSVDLSNFKSATIAQNSTTDCTKRLWVVKDDYGKVIDKLANSDTYTFSQYTYGRYYVSYAISNEFGFEGKTIEVIVGDGSSGGSVVVDSRCDNVPPTCGDGKCDNNEMGCTQCNGDCSAQYVDKGFRINGSFDDVVYLCSKEFVIQPIKGYFECGGETKYHFCWLSLFTWDSCPYYYRNYYIDVIECNIDKTEKSIVYTYSRRFEAETADDKYFNSVSSFNINYSFEEGKYYKIVLKEYFDDHYHYHPEGWISSYKYIYILPPKTFSNLSAGQTYIQTDIVFQDQRLTGWPTVDNSAQFAFKAKNSITIKPDTYISANSNFSIDPTLSINCSTVKSASIDTSFFSVKSDNIKNLTQNINSLAISDESNLSIYPNPNNGSFTALLKNDIITELFIINIYGQEVCFDANKNSDNSLSVTLPNCINGAYIVRLKGRQKTYTQKIIVKK